MERITQTVLAETLGVTRPFLCELLQGKRRVMPDTAARLESISGVGRMTWMYGRPLDIRRELERVYGRINFRRGRLPVKRGGKK